MKNVLKLISVVLFAFSISSCKKDSRSDDVVILYTTDVHCGVNDNLGYSAVEAYKKEMLKEYKYVTLFDAGDYIQGDVIGAFSKGKNIVDIMNKMNYQVVTIGNHEFDYGTDTLKEVINELDAEVVSCNLKYIGNKENKINKVKPYTIKKYGKLKIGVVGVTTPNTINESTPSIFKEDGEFAYSFTNESEEAYFKCIQNAIDLCNKEADYTVILSHAGNDENSKPWGSREIISNTNGYLAVMDGHSHYDVNWEMVKNKDGKDIPLCDAGTKINEFGKLIIHKDGGVTTELIENYEGRDIEITSFIDDKLKETENIANKVVAHTDLTLSIYDENGIRLVRSRETTIGNLVADAYQAISGADIGFINGGGVRADLPKGDVTYSNVFSVNPFGNYIVMKEVPGSHILDYLEHCSQMTEKEYVKDEHPYGEFGGFAQVSGLRYSIDTSIQSPVICDKDGNFIAINGPRRVKDVQVLENDNYIDIDINKTYKVATNNYILLEGGNGANMFMDDMDIETPTKIDYQVIADYITDVLKGNLANKYSSVEGRITIL